MTYLAVPICGGSVDRCVGQMRRAVTAGAETLELRTDYLEGLRIGMIRELIAAARIEASGLPIIVTCRDKTEGGAGDWPMPMRVEAIIAALEAGADYVDLEYANFLKSDNGERLKRTLSQNIRGRLILSAHNFERPFDDIKKLSRNIESSGAAAIPKLVYKANHINDCFEGFDVLRQGGGKRIVLCMGPAGVFSRIIAKKLGAFVTFASLDKDSATAPGQLTADEIRGLYRWDSMNTRTELFGVIGSPVGHSMSPAIFNAGFDAAGVNKAYVPLLLDGGDAELEIFFNKLAVRKWLGFRGFSVTIPHKSGAIDYVRKVGGVVEPLAARIGAANTVILTSDGRFKAYNTDYAGALDAITSKLGIDRAGLCGVKTAVIGAGGVARAIVAGLCDAGADVVICNRTVSKAEKLAAEFGCRAMALSGASRIKVDLLVNCTSVGMTPHADAMAVKADSLEKGMTVFDTVYNPVETKLLAAARAAGCTTIDGVSMFVGQALEQYRLFTGDEGDAELMRKVVLDRLGQ